MIDASSFEAFYKRTAVPLRAYVVRVIGNATSADDIVQESYLRLLRKPPPTDDTGQLRAYLFRIASNLIHDSWRRRQRERDAADRDPNETAPTPDIPLQIDMARVFEQLRPQQR